MAIKAIINNTEKEIEQIKNSNEQDIDYVYTRIKDVKTEGIVPLNFKSEGGNISDYRIYGNTVDGESVGDKTGNLFDGEFLQGYWAYANGTFSPDTAIMFRWVCTPKIPCIGNMTYTFSFDNPSRWAGFVWFDINGDYISTNNRSSGFDNGGNFTATSPANAAFMGINIAGRDSTGQVYYDIYPSDVTDFMLVEGSTPLPYEPYGYRVPVTVNENTTNIYLSSPLIKFGDDADYIDYKAQKRHNIDGTEELITLPILPMFNGNNTLSVETEVQPSNVCIKGGYDYKKVFIATRKIKGKVPLNYRNIEAIEGTLKNYRIYGQTAGGESVGDLVTSGEHAGEYKVPVTVSNGTDTLTTPIYLPEQIRKVGDEAEYIDYGEQKQHRVRVNLSEVNEFSNSITDTSNTLNIWVQQGKNDSFVYPPQQRIFVITEPTAITTSITITNANDSIRIKHNGSKSDIVIDLVRGLSPGAYSVSFNVLNYDHTTVGGLVINNIMVNKGSTALPYEPYIENTELDAVLPVLPTITGTNTLSVGTEVKPSAVEVKGKLKR